MSIFARIKEKFTTELFLWKYRGRIKEERNSMKTKIIRLENVEPSEFPLCEESLKLAKEKFIRDEWITLYCDKVFAVMVTNEIASKEKEGPDWVCNSYDMRPSFTYDDGEQVAGYRAYPLDGVHHIVITQEEKCYHSERIRLAEEFVLLYDLRLVERIDGSAEYYQINENGDDFLVAKVEGGCLRVLASFVYEYISIKSLTLVVQFEADMFSEKSIKELNEKEYEYAVYRSTDLVFSYTLSSNTLTKDKSYAFIRGKAFITPSPLYINRLFDRRDKRFECFIAGKDKEGNPIESTCEERKLSPNPMPDSSPWQLSLVFFKREVLDKYYADSRKYVVQDGALTGPSWFVHIDSDRGDNYVVMALKDLGKMPFKEQLHWKQYNVPYSADVRLSDTTCNRWFMGKPSDTKNACDFVFKSLYEEVNKKWQAKFGYPLFLELAAGDKHFFNELQSMNVLNNDSTFDNLILAFTKVVIDSLNEKELFNDIDETNDKVLDLFANLQVKDNKKANLNGGIRKLHASLLSKGIECNDLIELFNKIQALRSTSAAHRKSTHPDNKATDLLQWFGIGKYTHKDVIDIIFNRLNEQLSWLIQLCESYNKGQE